MGELLKPEKGEFMAIEKNSAVTENELRTAHLRAGLIRLGVSFEKAVKVPSIHTALMCFAKAARKRSNGGGNSAPEQLGLI